MRKQCVMSQFSTDLDHIHMIEWGVLANKPECKCCIYSLSFSIKITQLKSYCIMINPECR